MIVLNYRDSKPIYLQIKESLQKLILSGALEPGEKLESVRAMATSLSINPNTIQRAYNELEGEGYIYSIAGKGNFVCEMGESIRDEATLARQEKLLGKLEELVAELHFIGTDKTAIMDKIEAAYETNPEGGSAK